MDGFIALIFFSANIVIIGSYFAPAFKNYIALYFPFC